MHPDDPSWFKEALADWHMTIYHKHAKAWAAQGAIMEDIITNFELRSTRLLRVCPCCGHVQDKAFDLHREQEALAEPCPTSQFHFPVMRETETSTAVFKNVVEAPAERMANSWGDAKMTIQCVANGPCMVKGPVVLKGDRGEPIETTMVMSLCRCGGSMSKPFCDGTHDDWSGLPGPGAGLGGYFDRGPDMLLLELHGAQIAR